MSQTERWLLPEGIDELMPEQALQLEALRRTLIDKMQSWGYQLVIPPLVEYLESLLTGTAKTLDLQTFKLTDQMSVRMMGIRADITPQAARIAAHRLRDQQEVLRLCYIGNVLQTLPLSQGGSRNPIQVGAEIYGHGGPESDLEILQLMVEIITVSATGTSILLDIGHVGIYRGLAEQAGLTDEQEQHLFSALQRKSLPDIEVLLASYDLPASSYTMLLALAELNGGIEVLARAKDVFPEANDSVKQALSTLETIADLVQQRLPGVTLNFDLAELRGYHYHTGMVFAAYQTGTSEAIAMGGRYDDIGEEFGHGQPATGFSLDLKNLVVHNLSGSTKNDPISAVWTDDIEQQQLIEKLRNEGEQVVYQLTQSEDASRKIERQEGRWLVVETGTQIRG